MSDTTFDTIIIGGARPAPLLANRLSADGRHRVLLIEAGRGRLPLDPHPRGLPVLHRQPAHRLALPHRARRGPERPHPALPARQDAGGCSSINGMIYMRGQARDYDQWAELTGDASWRWDNACPTSAATRPLAPGPARGVNADFKRLHFGNKSTGSTGEWRWKNNACAGMCSTPLPTPRKAGGIPATDDFNQRQQRGRGLLRGQPEKRLALEHRQGLLRPPATAAPTSRCGPARRRPTHPRNPGRWQPALHRRAGVDRPRDGHGPRNG